MIHYVTTTSHPTEGFLYLCHGEDASAALETVREHLESGSRAAMIETFPVLSATENETRHPLHQLWCPICQL